ncbi:toll/interleukin-1 receptor domain-containing protein [Actinokineospora globicatena]|uniref:SEFIR domain-containing protein n=1 Tax=Actinokineospora globicatena TaxID=103729 RepID=A0A9W6QMD4_9PSEU|nr:toll/interleukin-1 receptor domain-containing protein [Actinokineospora globicatena]GLW91300.1 hypothetical protein Aglo03_21160 [Actinokineospora globicatena]
MPRVFVSYTHDSEEHKDAVLHLAHALSANGVSVCLDRWHLERQDWYTWAVREIESADFVVVVASARYRTVTDGYGTPTENLGLQCEAAILREKLQSERPLWTRKILPVLLPGRGIGDIPLVFQPNSVNHYPIADYTTDGMEDLLRVIHGKPAYERPLPGTPPPLPPRTVTLPTPHAVELPTPHPTVINTITGGEVHGNIIQAGGNVTQN